LGEEQVREFFVHLRTVLKAGPSAVVSARLALKCFFCVYLQSGHSWALWSQIRVRVRHKIPQLLNRPEIVRLLAAVTLLRVRMILHLIYHTGLRLGEALYLQVEDVDKPGLRLHVRHRSEHPLKNRRERFVPISPPLLELLNGFYLRHRHPKWLFPALSPNWQAQGLSLQQAALQAQGPMSARLVQEAMGHALASCAIAKKATPHTLRHCFATHLLEEGVNLRVVSTWLGHQHLTTTLTYLQYTEINEAQARLVQERLLVPKALH
jgi:integrase